MHRYSVGFILSFTPVSMSAIPARPEHSHTIYVGRLSRSHLMTHVSFSTQPERQTSMPYSIPSYFFLPFRHGSATAITHLTRRAWRQRPDMFGVEVQIKRNRSPKSEPISSGHHAALQAGVAWTTGHTCRKAPSFFPTAGVYCPTSPKLLETADNRVVALDPPKTPTSSARQTPPRDAHRRGRNCARSDSLDFSAC